MVSTEHNDDFKKQLTEIINQNITNPKYSLDDLCSDCNLSRSQLHRKVKEETGLSASLYVRHIRLNMVKQLLKDTDQNISEISYQVGFSSPQSISKYFHSAFGQTPSQYRASCPSGKEDAQHEQIEDILESNPHNEFKPSENEFKPVDVNVEDSFSLQESKAPIEILAPDRHEKASSKTIGNGMKLTLIVSIGLIGLALIMLLTIQNSSKLTEISTANPVIFKNSVAVLPFINLGPKTADHFCIGIQDDILTKLTFFKDLKVISRTSVDTYKNSNKSLMQIGSELGVSYILEGSVRTINNKVAITAQLIRASDDFHVWADNYVRNVDDIFEIQNEISLEIAKTLNQKITKQEEQLVENYYKPSKDAYTQLLIGKELLKERTHTTLLASISKFDNALATDPEYVDALVNKANAYQLLGNIGYNRSSEYSTKAQKHALEAIKLQPKNAKAYAVLACNYRDKFEWDQAKISFEIALSHSPSDALINYWYSLMLRETGEIDRAINYSSKARELDPLYPVIHGGHIVNCAYAGEYDLAAKAIEEGKILFGQSFMHHWAKAVYAESKGDHQEAINSFEDVLQLNPELNSVHTGIIFNQGRLDMTQKVNDFIRSKNEDSADDYYAIAMAYMGLKDVDKSLEYLSKAIHKGIYPSDILIDNNFDFMRNHPEYVKIISRFGLDKFSKDVKEVEVI